MIIWGTRSVKSTRGSGQFHCPHCQATRSYTHVRARRFGHVYWIPLIPMGEGLEYVECRSCRNAWQPSVLERQQEDASSLRDHFTAAVLSTAVAVASANGHIDQAEVEAIYDVVERVTGNPPDKAAILEIAKNADSRHLELAENLLKRVEPALSSQGKELIVEVAFLIAYADGTMDKSESDVVMRIATALSVSQAHLKGIMAGFVERAAA